MTAADTRTGNAAWFGTVEEHGEPAYYAMRLRIRSGMITEVETVIERKPGLLHGRILRMRTNNMKRSWVAHRASYRLRGGRHA